MAAKPKSRASRIVLIVGAIVAILIIAIVLAFVVVPGSSKVSIKEASLSWEYNNLAKYYHVSNVTLKLTNNGKDQLFDLYVQVEGNWPVEYESQRGFYTRVGAGLNAGETRTISDNSWNNWYIGSTTTKQTGTYTATFRVGKITATSNIITGYQFADVYGECTITTRVP